MLRCCKFSCPSLHTSCYAAASSLALPYWSNPHVDFLVLQCVCRRPGGQTSLFWRANWANSNFLESNILAGCLSNPHFNRSCFWPFLSSHKNHHSLTVSCEGVRVFSRNFGRPFLPNFCQNHSGRHFFPSFFFTLCSSQVLDSFCLRSMQKEWKLTI